MNKARAIRRNEAKRRLHEVERLGCTYRVGCEKYSHVLIWLQDGRRVDYWPGAAKWKSDSLVQSSTFDQFLDWIARASGIAVAPAELPGPCLSPLIGKLRTAVDHHCRLSVAHDRARAELREDRNQIAGRVYEARKAIDRLIDELEASAVPLSTVEGKARASA